MPFRFVCPHCAHEVLVADEYGGQSGACRQCGQTITMPGGQSGPFADGLLAGTSPAVAEHGAALRMLIPIDRSLWAIAAGYLGLLAPLVIPAPFAIAAGLLACRDIRLHPGKHGLGRAIFGIGMGTIVLIALLFLLFAANA